MEVAISWLREYDALAVVAAGERSVDVMAGELVEEAAGVEEAAVPVEQVPFQDSPHLSVNAQGELKGSTKDPNMPG